MRIRTIAVAIAFLASTTLAFADGGTTKDDAVAMVKKAVAPERVNDFETPGVMRLASERFD